MAKTIRIGRHMPRELHQMVRYAADCVVCELHRSTPLTAEQMELTEEILRETLTGALCAVWESLQAVALVEVRDGDNNH